MTAETGRVRLGAVVDTRFFADKAAIEFLIPLFDEFSLLRNSKEPGVSDWTILPRAKLHTTGLERGFATYKLKDIVGGYRTKMKGNVVVVNIEKPFLSLNGDQQLTVTRALLFEATKDLKVIVPVLATGVDKVLPSPILSLLNSHQAMSQGEVVSVLRMCK